MSAEEQRVRVEPPEPGGDPKAEYEAIAIARGELRRDEALRSHLHHCSVILLYFGVIVLLVCAGVWLYHLLTPIPWHFLTTDQRSQLQNLLISALGSSVVTDYGRRMLEKAGKRGTD